MAELTRMSVGVPVREGRIPTPGTVTRFNIQEGGRKRAGKGQTLPGTAPNTSASRGLRDPVQRVAGRAVPPRNVTGSVNNTKQKVRFLVVLKVRAKLRCKLKISVFYSRNLFIFSCFILQDKDPQLCCAAVTNSPQAAATWEAGFSPPCSPWRVPRAAALQPGLWVHVPCSRVC